MKRRLQFGLGSLLLLVVASAIGIKGYLMWTAERRAVEALQLDDSNVHLISDERPRIEGSIYPYYRIDLGPRAGFEHLRDLPRVYNLNIEARDLTEAEVRILARCVDLRGLHLTKVRGVPAALKATRDFPNLTYLHVSMSDLTDADLKEINPAVESLELRQCTISDAGLATLQLKNLKTLQVDGELVTDRSIAGLTHCPNLEELYTHGMTQATDASFETLAALPKLKLVRLYSDELTDAGFERLRKSRSLDQVVLQGERLSRKTLDQGMSFGELKLGEGNAGGDATDSRRDVP
jgi:hypothetical protein